MFICCYTLLIYICILTAASLYGVKSKTVILPRNVVRLYCVSFHKLICKRRCYFIVIRQSYGIEIITLSMFFAISFVVTFPHEVER
jgi:hypothetical protein